jgi:hypothetical protein
MKHPVEGDLALFAGRDLNVLEDWRVRQHVARCEECRATVESYEALRSRTAELGELPAEISWNRLASEMKANIRLGLAAGECVAGARLGASSKPGALGFLRPAAWHTVMAYAGLIALVAAGILLQRPEPPALATAPAVAGSQLTATGDGIELSEAGGSFGLRYGAPRAREINYSADARGSMGARYVDTRTGYVTVVSVNVE